MLQGLIDTLQNMGQYNWNAPVWLGPVVFLGVVWSLIWKGMALWKSARVANKPWFIVLLLVNTVGILDILYIYVFSKKQGNTQM